jgi:hypothetical protein
MIRRSDCTSQKRNGKEFISTRDCLVLLLAAHAAIATAFLVYASDASLAAAAVAAAQVFPAAFQFADRVVSPCYH